MKIYFTLLFLILSTYVSAQKPLTISRPLDSLPLHAERFVGRDQFASYYFINNNIFTKIQPGGSLEYKNILKGNLASADINNPLLILLFYKDFNSIVLVDHQLNEVRQINFNENTDFQIQAHAAGIASQNRVWIYDGLNQRILLFDYNKNTFRTLPVNNGIIRHYESDFNEFRWIDDDSNIYSCDVYGKASTLGKAPAFDRCAIVSPSQIIYQLDGKLYLHSLVGNKSTLIDTGKKSSISFYYKDQILSIFTKHGITNFKIILP
ncbi:MAG TPA: hypothetical protein VGB43_06375 [Flavobacterium sp.]|jgi:hypothetical protein